MESLDPKNRAVFIIIGLLRRVSSLIFYLYFRHHSFAADVESLIESLLLETVLPTFTRVFLVLRAMEQVIHVSPVKGLFYVNVLSYILFLYLFSGLFDLPLLVSILSTTELSFDHPLGQQINRFLVTHFLSMQVLFDSLDSSNAVWNLCKAHAIRHL